MQKLNFKLWLTQNTAKFKFEKMPNSNLHVMSYGSSPMDVLELDNISIDQLVELEKTLVDYLRIVLPSSYPTPSQQNPSKQTTGS